MTKSLHSLLHLILLAAVALGFALSPAAALAQGGVTIDRIDPGSVPNTMSTNVVVYGSGFVEGAVVILGGAGALSTSYVSPSVLTAVVPAGLTPGTFDVTVVISGTSATKPGALTIVGPTNTPAPTAYVRPLLVVQSYGASSASLVPGSDIDFEMTLANSGQAAATNVAVNFTPGDLVPRVTGGVRSVPHLAPGESARIFQPFTVSSSVSGQRTVALEVQVTYFDANGQNYSETFTLTFAVFVPQGPFATQTPTPTPTQAVVQRPQLIITAYRIDVEQLQPGTRFTLELDVQNLGSAEARRVTMIAGGGDTSGGAGPDGTPVPGGVSGGGGDFTNFAPVGASNVQSLGDLAAGAELVARQSFVVNATTKAGAYPMQFSFVYGAPTGTTYTDDQVITLLVYQLPQVDVNFYREVGPLFAFQPNPLPLQIVNLGRNSSVLGNMKVTAPQAPGAQFSNNVSLVGALDPGGFFPLDAMVIPEQPGPLELLVTVDYTDDFNQTRQITETFVVEVMDAPPIDPGMGPGPGEPGGEPIGPPAQPETLWQRFLRFVRGLFGLDSGPTQPTGPEGFPPGGEGIPPEGEGIPPVDGGPVGPPPKG